MTEDLKEMSAEIVDVRDQLMTGFRYSIAHGVNHLIHDHLDRMHDTTSDLLDKEDQNDKDCIKLLQLQSQELLRLLQIRMSL